ncbi:hypothetical protein [Microbacterium sp. B35-30]|uniref:hypothetical protein n=1 Tax=Microbacterium sp. B35-30 TaxID=1962642 RepID=UPI0013D526ED|nr:hypothetical protein [Microbacterium sp. B35-30]KAF2418101.1 hypothetical protein B2K11_09460 [Microbacterium sp. B35-30]
MDVWIWAVVAGLLLVALAVVRLKRRARGVYVIDHVQVEMHPACVVEDRVIEQVWRSALSMTNLSRRPRAVPTFAERSTVRAGRREYLASVYFDVDDLEMNPRAVALAWIEYVLPMDAVPGRGRLTLLGDDRRRRVLAFAMRPESDVKRSVAGRGNLPSMTYL